MSARRATESLSDEFSVSRKSSTQVHTEWLYRRTALVVKGSSQATHWKVTHADQSGSGQAGQDLCGYGNSAASEQSVLRFDCPYSLALRDLCEERRCGQVRSIPQIATWIASKPITHGCGFCDV